MENKSTKLFINKTTNTQDAYMKFLKFHSKTFSFSYILYTVFWSFLFTLCIFLAFRGNARIQGVLLTIALIGFIAYRFFKPRMIMDNELKSEKVSTKSVNTYTFYERSFQIKNKNGTFNYKYFMINKVFETSEYFYLYVSKENAFLVSKNTFSLGTPTDFSSFMRRKFKLKYKLDKNV
ncbi:MAG: YcxB family protein [Clostridia bacterium]|nr:YcxB family protein [Clostridia bacterium]